MNEDEIKGTAKKVIGTAQEVAGKVANDEQLEGKGYLNQALGTVQDVTGKVRDKVKDIVDDAPSAAKTAIDTGRDYARRGSAAVARATGDNTVLIAAVTAGIAGLAVGWFAWSRRGSKKTGE
ncbi:CsbD family protein [Sphingomonas sp. CGMCC 1.13654]|uniref:CsbD family protein n=1 Tax=Sphingomonas chungangi TaxID=2683589 RepID=A0A838L441_9SPHN|nr:CsbD family protein [Sphingomonas chungangi]MBA2933189.1 CsbD family protein [Sphingomonas chungangi]MVW57861.1 CsbD family protein [Sphingomonas chungangi]